jgi:hypothetical protein
MTTRRKNLRGLQTGTHSHADHEAEDRRLWSELAALRADVLLSVALLRAVLPGGAPLLALRPDQARRVDIITTEGESDVMGNLKRKAEAADRMFSMMVEEMRAAAAPPRPTAPSSSVPLPSWLSEGAA